MTLDMDNARQLKEWLATVGQTLVVIGDALLEQQERIQALEMMTSPFPIPMVAPVPVRDLSVGEDVDKSTPQPL